MNNLFENAISDIEDYAIILLDKEGHIISWNKGAEKIKGYTADEIIGKSFTQFYTEEDKANGLPCHLLEEATKNGRVENEGWRLGNNEDMFWASVVITATHDDEGNHTGFIKVTRDLSERVAAEKVISEYERSIQEQGKQAELMKELYVNFISEVEDYAIIMLDKDGYIMDWNKGATNIKGYSTEEIIGKHFSILYLEEDAKASLPDALLYKANVNGIAQHEGWRRKKDGTKFWGNITIKALYDNNQAVKGYVKITKNLTTRMLADKALNDYANRLEEEIKKVNDIDDELNKRGRKLNLSSQIRTRFEYAANNTMQKPILNTLSSIEKIKKQIDNSPSVLNELKKISVSTHQVGKQIIDLSRLSVVLEDRIDTSPSDFDILNLINILKDKLTAQSYSNHNIEIEHHGNSIVHLPQPIVSSTIENLISNAIKFSPNNNDIIINYKNLGGSISISIEDNGLGIPDGEVGNLYEPFFRGSNVDNIDGAGLSLYLVKNYIDSMRGKISCQSILNKGTVFTIELPLKPTAS